jgi:hypothetical protein
LRGRRRRRVVELNREPRRPGRSNVPKSGAQRPEGRSSDEPVGGDGASRSRERWKGLLALESIALAIALVAPVTPSKTGSTWSPAELFAPEPTYLQDVLASFILVNLMFVVLAAAVGVAAKLRP